MKVSLNPDDWAPRIQTAAKPATSVMTYGDNAFARRLRAVLAEKSEVVATSLRQGAPPTLEADRQMVGELEGLNFALNALLAVERELSGNDPAKPQENPLYVS